MDLVLHSYWRSTSPYRVRIGLNLKGLAYRYAPVDLPAGEHRATAYRAISNLGLTPALEIDGRILTQSLAILEWLDETHPEPALLPKDPFDRATVRAIADIIACDIHPLNNLRVARALKGVKVSEVDRQTWTARWITEGFAAIEPMIALHSQGFAFGATPTIADCCLIPQVYSAHRYQVELSAFPAIRAVAEHAAGHAAFADAHPDRQPDAPAT